jgi:hypothetical protein
MMLMGPQPTSTALRLSNEPLLLRERRAENIPTTSPGRAPNQANSGMTGVSESCRQQEK